MDDPTIKDKVREIQHRYCGASVETKLYWAIKETTQSKPLANNTQRVNSKIPKALEPGMNTSETRKGCGKIFTHEFWGKRKCGMFEDLKHSDHFIYCQNCSQNHEEASLQ